MHKKTFRLGIEKRETFNGNNGVTVESSKRFGDFHH